MNDDDDIPLVFSIKAASAKQPNASGAIAGSVVKESLGGVPSSQVSKSSKDVSKGKKGTLRDDVKESKDTKKDTKDAKKSKRTEDWDEVHKSWSPQAIVVKRPNTLLGWCKANKTATFFIAFIIIIVGCRIGEELMSKTKWDTFKDMEDPFKTLGVSRSASDSEIRSVYRKLSLKLHPDKNPDATLEDREKFVAVTKAYKVLTDPVKRARWMNSENPEATPLQSDTVSLTDKEMDAQLTAESAWLVLAYADWSSESWDLADEWEAIGRDLGRYIQVGRIDCEKEPRLAARFNVGNVPMIYSYVDGVITRFHGQPSVANVTLFLAKALADDVSVVRDANAGSFLEESPEKVKVMLFAPPGLVKLRFAFRALARRYRSAYAAAEITFSSADTLRQLFGVTREPAVVFVKEKGSRPLRYSGKMTYGRLSQLLLQHRFLNAPRLSASNYEDMCGAGGRGTSPCAVYLHDSSLMSSSALAAAQATLAAASAHDLRAARAAAAGGGKGEGVERFSTVFGWVDLAYEGGLRAALGPMGVAGKVVAISAERQGGMVWEGGALEEAPLVAWGQGLSQRDAADFDPLKSKVVLRRESPSWNIKGRLKRQTPQLMMTIGLLAAWLLYYALYNIYLEFRSSRLRDRFRRAMGKSRDRLAAAERARQGRWEDLQAANRLAAERRRAEAEEREASRRRAAEAAAAAQAASEDKKPAAAPPSAKAQSAAGGKSTPPPARAAPTGAAGGGKGAAGAGKRYTEAEVRAAAEKVVMEGDLTTLTKRHVRKAVERACPGLSMEPDALRLLVSAAVDAALLARAAAAAS